VIVDSSGNKCRGKIIRDADKTITVDMQVSSDGHSAQVEFQEMWGMDGAGIYSQLEERMMAEEPKYYTLCASEIEVEVVYKVMHHVVICTKDDCECVVRERGPYVYRYKLAPISGKLLVNGTGVWSLAE